MSDHRDLLFRSYQAALQAVSGVNSVSCALADFKCDQPLYLVAIGKAAGAMMQGVLQRIDRFEAALLISKYHHIDRDLYADERIECLEAAHPTPDENSLKAGRRLIEFVESTPRDARFLFLISGGASALVEHLPSGVSLADLQRLNQWLLASGLPIHDMNPLRQGLSLLKGGRLRHYLQQRQAQALLISDVQGDEPAVIGSGLLYQTLLISDELFAKAPEWLQMLLTRSREQLPVASGLRDVPHQIVATNDLAQRAAVTYAEQQGVNVYRHGNIDGDALLVGAEIADYLLTAPAGVHIWGGETTVLLPENPGRGGRCQALALTAAQGIAGRDDITLLAAGTDGSDGPCEDAGAMVDGSTVAKGESCGLNLNEMLNNADGGSFLAECGDLIQTGPTGTNVMDLVIAYKKIS